MHQKRTTSKWCEHFR